MSQTVSARAKLPYHAPLLQVHGDFRQITLGGSFNCPDGVNNSKNPAQGAPAGACVQD
ncbi:hypothetical protein BH23GEM5_BH23GEM5_15650 [soil metagenome]